MNIKLPHVHLLNALGSGDGNLSRAAETLGLSQPSASRLLAEAEEALGGPLFVRKGKRLAELTALGRAVLEECARIAEAERSLAGLAAERRDPGAGELRIAVTHAQARHFLPRPMTRFRQRWPRVKVSLVQGMPRDLVGLVAAGEADVVICTERLEGHPALDHRPLYRWRHALCLRRADPLERAPLTLARIAAEPILTYTRGITGRATLERAFAERGLSLNVTLEAADTDVLKTFVRAGFGAAIVAAMTYEPAEDSDLVLRDLASLGLEFETRAAWARGRRLRQFERSFLEILAEEGPLIERRIARALEGA